MGNKAFSPDHPAFYISTLSHHVVVVQRSSVTNLSENKPINLLPCLERLNKNNSSI